jgi:hypothetical protein
MNKRRKVVRSKALGSDTPAKPLPLTIWVCGPPGEITGNKVTYTTPQGLRIKIHDMSL